MRLFANILLLVLLVLTSTSAGFTALIPAELDTINYTQVFFKWPPLPQAASYHFQIAYEEIYDPFDVALVYETDVETNADIVYGVFEWGSTYMWRYWSIDAEGNPMDTSRTHQFSIMPYPDSLATVATTTFLEEQVQPGFNVFGFDGGYQAAFDIEGNTALLVPGGGESELLPSGDILCFAGGRGDRNLYRTSLDGDTIFISPQSGNYHHEVDYTYRGTYLTLDRAYRWVPNPGDVPDSLQGDSLLWEGDVIFEFNADGDTVWSWDCHDYFSYEDYELDEILEVAGGGEPHDWTHSNAVHFTPDGSALYLSVRHLSRVTLIDYESKDMIWNMGKEMPSGDVGFGHDLNISYIHDPEWQPNDNILIFDNHNLGPEDSSRAVEVSIDFDRDPVAQIEYEAWSDSAALSQGDADRLPNGNTLATFGRNAVVTEYNADSEKVWELVRSQGPLERNNRIYRCQRVPSLFPLAYTIYGPQNEDHVPAGDSYVQFTINNIGHADQWYVCEVTDNEGWFSMSDRWVHIDALGSATITVRGEAGEDMMNDTLTVTVYPARNMDMVDTWTAVVITDDELSVEENETLLPSEVSLNGNYPNPFNSETIIEYSLPSAGPASMTVYNSNGRFVKRLISGKVEAGNHKVVWDGTNLNGEAVPSGNYYLLLKYGDQKVTQTMTYMR